MTYEDYMSQSTGEEDVKCGNPICQKPVKLKELSPMKIRIGNKKQVVGVCFKCYIKLGGK